MLVLDAAAVRACLPPAGLREAMRQCLLAFAEGSVHHPMRSVIAPDQLSGMLVLKPALVSGKTPAFGMKAVTLFPDNPKRGLPAVSGFVSLLDPETGHILALLDGGVVTELRTGAVSALATDELARPEAGDLALIGAGVQARAHLVAIAEIRELRRVRVWSRTTQRAAEFAAWAAENGHEVEVVSSAEAAATGADIICTVTTSAEPILRSDWVSPGAHINAVGAFQPAAREIDGPLVARAKVVVDSRESALAEAGDLLLAVKDGLIDESRFDVELGSILLGGTKVRTDPDDLTLFESLGLAVEDVSAAAYAFAEARRQNLGVELAFG
jgi:alanine dehydrogenase